MTTRAHRRKSAKDEEKLVMGPTSPTYSMWFWEANAWGPVKKVEVDTVTQALTTLRQEVFAKYPDGAMVLVGSSITPALATYRLYATPVKYIQERVTP